MRLSVILSAFSLLAVSFSKAQMDDKFYQPSKTMEPIENVSFQEFSIPTGNDTITGIILEPKPKQPKATVLFFHGAGGNVTNYLFMTKPLVENGYRVAMIDFRGYGKSTGNPTHLNVAEDGQIFFDYMLNKSEVQKSKIILYGASLGSQIASNLAKNNGDKISGLVIDGGMTSFTDIAIFYAPEYEEVISQYLVSPYSAEENVKKMKSFPKLFIHSKEDKVVPYKQGVVNFNNATEPKKLLEYSGSHLDGLVTETQSVLKEMNKMLN